MTIAKLGFGKKLALGAALVSTFLAVTAAAESKARIVRLSDVEGTVQIDRAGDGFEKAFINLPMVEGTRLKTGLDGRAEVEFEDGSAFRLGNNSEIEFARLALGDDGQKINGVKLISGTAYANLREKKGDQFLLNFCSESIAIPEAAHFRVVLSGPNTVTVAVFKGSVSVAGASGKFDVAEKHSATIHLDAVNDSAKSDSEKSDVKKNGAFVVAKNYDQEPLDGWDRQQNDYHQRYTPASSAFSSPYGYGASDLSYYGAFNTFPGYGFGWQPFFADASWNPFMDGAWSWYPGAGYMWVSGYPWGWMPYRYGAWNYAPGYGWIWQPGNWNSWYATPQFRNAPATAKIAAAPLSGHKTVLVGMGLTANPTMAPHKLTINPGSAGMGVPRGSVRHLDHYAEKMGHTSAPVIATTQPPPQTVNPGMGSEPSMRGASAGSSGMHPSPMSSGSHHGAGPAPSPRPH